MRDRGARAALRVIAGALFLGAVLCAATPAAPAESPLDNVLGLLGKGFSTKSLPGDLPVVINADTLSFEEETGIALAEGHVEVAFGDKKITADKMMYNAATREAELVSHVHYVEKGDEFSFDRIVLSLDTEKGVLERGTIRLSTNNYRISSERFEKTGARSFFIGKGSLTTCPCDPEPDWRFDIGRSNVTIDGYAVARNVTFKVRGIPVLWLPYAAFPVKLSRQSGFLMPSYTKSGSKGYSFQVPYYWAINRWSDATVTLEAMSKRGIRPEVEYRFVPNSLSMTEIRGTAHQDRVTGDTRYRLFGTNVFRFGDMYTANGQWDIPSDDDYYVDLIDADLLRSARHIASRAFVARTTENASQALGAVWVKDLQGAPVDNTLQRLPEYAATFLPASVGIGRIEASGELQAAYLYRREGGSDVRGRGYVELSRAFPLYESVSATPYIGADVLGSSTGSLHADNQAGRLVPIAGAVVQAELKREFQAERGGKYVHAVAPGASFQWIPRIDQGGIPIADQWSRLGSQDQLAFSLVQRVIRLAPNAGPKEVASLELTWALELGRRKTTDSPYIDPMSPYERALRDQIDLAAGHSKNTGAASDVFGRLRVSPVDKVTVTGEALFDPADARFSTGAVGAEWNAGTERRALLEYRFSRDLAEDVHALVSLRPIRRVGVAAEASYSLRDGRLTDSSSVVTLYPRSACWSVGLGMGRKTRPEETTFKVTFSLTGIGTIGH